VPDSDHISSAIGCGDFSVERVFDYLRPNVPDVAILKTETAPEDLTGGITLVHLDDPMVRFAQCCNPVPGDPVFGFVTRGRGVSVHHRDCPNAAVLHQEPDRIISVEWEEPEIHVGKGPFKTAITVKSSDRVGMLGVISTEISATGANFRHADIRTNDESGNMAFLIEVKDLRQLKRVISKVRRLPDVYEVRRIASTRDEDEIRAIVEALPLPNDESEGDEDEEE
jgi:(p)ppGpp synthase/HD superfamily hydrolase